MSSIDHPDHYTQGGVECIDAIKSAIGDEGFEDYLVGNCIKYLWRYKHKNGLEDLKKCQWYLNCLISGFADRQTSSKHSETRKLPTKICLSDKYGILFQKDDVVYGEDGVPWKVIGFSKDKEYPIIGKNHCKGERWLKLEWLHHKIVENLS